jgi:hypothetical protein
MSILLIIFLICVLVLIFSQFGGKLSATSAWHWWMVGFFLVVATFEPEFYRPVATLLGIKFISNFVLASLVMFLFMQALGNQVASVEMIRRHRKFVSSDAVRQYFRSVTGQGDLHILVVLPTYNEESSVPSLARDLEALRVQDPFLSYCFINDGSIDGTAAKLSELLPRHSVEHLSNINVSGVLQTGFEIAHKLGVDWVVQCDSDGQHPVGEIKRLISVLRENNFDCVIGSRFVGLGLVARLKDDSTSILRVLGGQSLRLSLRLLFGVRVSDPTSGFRVYSKKAVEVLRRNIPDEYPEPESIALMAAAGLRVSEVFVQMNPRTSGVSSLSGGFKSVAYMIKVISALIGLRIRSCLG